MGDIRWITYDAYSQENVDLFNSNLKTLIETKGSDLTYQDVNLYDLLHPGKHDGIDHLFTDYNILPNSRVLEIGIGLGGTSRYLHFTKNVRIFGFDFVQRLVDASVSTNRALNLGDAIEHVQGDVCTISLSKDFNVAFSVGVFVHVDSEAGFFNVVNALVPGGLLYLEEYYFKKDPADFTEEDKELVEARFLIGVRTKPVLLDILTRAGLEIVEVSDFGSNWSEAAWERAEKMLIAHRAGKSTIPEGLFHQSLNISTKITCELGAYSDEELLAKFPNLNTVFNVVNRVRQKSPLAGVVRIVGKKI